MRDKSRNAKPCTFLDFCAFGSFQVATLGQPFWQSIGVVKAAMQGDQPNPVCKMWSATLASSRTWTTLTIGAATLGTMPSPAHLEDTEEGTESLQIVPR